MRSCRLPMTPKILFPPEMALNAQILKTRSLTAIVFVAVIAAGLFGNAWSYLVLFGFLLIACWREYGKIIDRIQQRSLHPYLYLGWILNGLALALFFSGADYRIDTYLLRDNLTFPLTLAGFIFLVRGTLASDSISFRHWGMAAAGNLYVTLPWAVAMHMYALQPAPSASALFFDPAVWWVVIVIACMWVNDTMAYVLGSMFGRTPFSKISPKKTWEGTLSGIIFATAIVGSVLNAYLSDAGITPIEGYGLVFLAAVSGTLGDLFESKLKRMAGVKDSGKLMPGHGGVLDRFDSLLLALPWVYLYLICIR